MKSESWSLEETLRRLCRNLRSVSGEQQLLLYLVLIAALGTFLAAIGRRSAPGAMMQIPAKQRSLGKRTLAATVLILLFIPLTIFTGVMDLGNRHYNVMAMMVLVIICGVAFGGETGFLVGAVTMLVSNILFSQGPWVPW